MQRTYWWIIFFFNAVMPFFGLSPLKGGDKRKPKRDLNLTHLEEE